MNRVSEEGVTDFAGYLPSPPRTGAERLRWFAALDAAISLDILNVRLQLRAAGLPPAAIEAEMLGYREWITGRVGAVCDLFALEVAWTAA